MWDNVHIQMSEIYAVIRLCVENFPTASDAVASLGTNVALDGRLHPAAPFSRGRGQETRKISKIC